MKAAHLVAVMVEDLIPVESGYIFLPAHCLYQDYLNAYLFAKLLPMIHDFDGNFIFPRSYFVELHLIQLFCGKNALLHHYINCDFYVSLKELDV